jgi:hypothetical protein
MKKNILLLISTIVILLILSEAGARIWTIFKPLQEYPDMGGYSYFPYLPYSPTPKFTDLDSLRVLNSRGFRNSVEFSIPKPANTFRIICLGGSTTYDDYGEQKDKDTWAGRLEHYLNLHSAGKKYEVINASGHNYDTYMNLIDFMTRCRDLQPDIIIIFEGINEIYFNGFDNVSFAHTNVFQPFNFNYHSYFYNLNHNMFLKYSMFLRLCYIKFFINPLNLNVMSTKKVHHYEIANLKNIAADSLFTFKKGLEGFIAISKADNSKIVFLSQAYNFKNFKNFFILNTEDYSEADERLRMLKEETARIHEKMKLTALQNDIPFLDMNEVLNQNDSLFANSMDAVHFSKTGSSFFGLRVYNFLVEKKLVD